MELTVGFGIRDKSLARFRYLSRMLQILSGGFGKFIIINEIVPCVVWRVDVDEFDLAEVGFLKQFECVEVVTLDKQVLRRVEVDRFLTDRTQRLGDRRVGSKGGCSLAGPVEPVPFLRTFDDVVRELLSEKIEVDGALGVAIGIEGFRYDRGEQLGDLFDVLLGQIRRCHTQLVHGVTSAFVL